MTGVVITAWQDVRIRRDLASVALGRSHADRGLHVGRLLDADSRRRLADREIATKGWQPAHPASRARVMCTAFKPAFPLPKR